MILGRTGLAISQLGFGSYRIAQSEAHAKALRQALASGVNLIDTSSNYTDGESESLIGLVIEEAQRQDMLRREDVIIVSKVGYVQGKNMVLVKQSAREGRPYADVVEYDADCWHCMSPEFISDQLTLSLRRLRIAAIDVYLLHNPEYFFTDALRREPNANLAALRHTFYERIRRAFVRLEEEADKGRIRFYGVSSNTFVCPSGEGEFASVARMLEIAREIGCERGSLDGHRFGVIQLPANLIEHGAFTELNNDGRTAIAFAAAANIGVLVNRPLNAFTPSGLIRLADFAIPELTTSLGEQIIELERLESELPRKILPLIPNERDRAFAVEAFCWSAWFRDIASRHLPPEHWPKLEHEVLRPHLTNAFRHFTQLLSEHPVEWAAWRNAYLPQALQTLQIARAEALKVHQLKSDAIAAAIAPFLPESLATATLARKALAVVTSQPGVSCVLNGMRHRVYVDDAAAVMHTLPFQVDPSLFRAVGRLD